MRFLERVVDWIEAKLVETRGTEEIDGWYYDPYLTDADLEEMLGGLEWARYPFGRIRPGDEIEFP